jgi:hypothetical protein
MSIIINAKGTSVPFFTIGKNGTTIYQGSIDPSLAYTPKNGDVWFNSGTNVISSWIAPTTSWSAPQLADIKFSGSSILAATSTDLSLVTDPGKGVVLNAGAGPAKLSTTIGNDLYINDSLGGSLYLNNLKWPAADGSSNQVLTTNGAGILSWTNASAGTVTSVGLADFSIAPIYSITNTPITSSGDISMALVAQSANTAFLGPNGSSGQPSFRNIAYADLPLKLYTENPTSPSTSVAAGINTVVIGDGANATLYGAKAFANGVFSSTGDAQHGVYVLRNITTNATSTELYLDGVSQSFVLPLNSVVSFSIIITARRTDSAGGAAGYQFDGVVMKDSSAASITLIGTPSKTVLGETDSPWDVSLTTNTTNGSLKIMAIGETGKTIRWAATVLTTEVTN